MTRARFIQYAHPQMAEKKIRLAIPIDGGSGGGAVSKSLVAVKRAHCQPRRCGVSA